MKSFPLTVYTIIIFFLLVMGTVAATAFRRASNSTGIDPAQINRMREMANTSAIPNAQEKALSSDKKE